MCVMCICGGVGGNVKKPFPTVKNSSTLHLDCHGLHTILLKVQNQLRSYNSIGTPTKQGDNQWINMLVNALSFWGVS